MKLMMMFLLMIANAFSAVTIIHYQNNNDPNVGEYSASETTVYFDSTTQLYRYEYTIFDSRAMYFNLYYTGTARTVAPEIDNVDGAFYHADSAPLMMVFQFPADKDRATFSFETTRPPVEGIAHYTLDVQPPAGVIDPTYGWKWMNTVRPQPVPEPTSAMLVGLGVMGLVFRRKRPIAYTALVP